MQFFSHSSVFQYYVLAIATYLGCSGLWGSFLGVSAFSLALQTSWPARAAGVCIFMLCELVVRSRVVRPQHSAKPHILFCSGSKSSSYTTCHLSDSVEFAQEQSQGAALNKQQRSRSRGKYEPRGLCLLRCDLFTTAAAQPALWIKPQNLDPADTCIVDAVLHIV